jgi:transposase
MPVRSTLALRAELEGRRGRAKIPVMRVYSRAFRLEAARRVLAGEKVPTVAGELGIHRKLLYDWVRRVSEGGEANLRERGRPRKVRKIATVENARWQIAELQRTIAQQQLIITFFRHALQRVEVLRPVLNEIGVTASFRPSRP